MTIVGLPANDAKETVELVRSAIKACGYTVPRQRITVEFSAPGERTRISGAEVALPIALAILAADGQVALPDRVYYGGLSLAGAVRTPTRGLLAVAAMHDPHRAVVTGPAAVPSWATVLTAATLHDAYKPTAAPVLPPASRSGLALSDFRAPVEHHAGILTALRACAEGRPLVLVGKPGCGKSMLARRIFTLMPPLTDPEHRETSVIHDAAGLGGAELSERPFRAPHHTATLTGLLGEPVGKHRPGECAIAHNGVLFLDEAHEFERKALTLVIEVFRRGAVTKAITGGHGAQYPALFRLALATEPEHLLQVLRAFPSNLSPVVLDLAVMGTGEPLRP